MNYDQNLKEVSCSLKFITIGEIDTTKENYQAFIEIKSKWDDDSISVDSLNKTIASKDWKNWEPKLFIENASFDKSNLEEINYCAKKIENRIQVTETRTFKGTFWERMEISDFPFDIQELTVCVSSKNKCRIIPDTSRITLIDDQKYSVLSEQVIKTFRHQQQYKLYRLIKYKEHASYDEDLECSGKKNGIWLSEPLLAADPSKAKFVAKIKCSRRSPFYLVNNFLFNFIITSLSFTLFAIDPKMAQTRLGGTFTLLLTSFSFKVVTSKSLPTVAYLTSLDKYQLVNILFLALCCTWHSILASLIHNDFKKKSDDIALICLASIFSMLEIFYVIALIISHKKVTNLKKHVDDLISQFDQDKLVDTED